MIIARSEHIMHKQPPVKRTNPKDLALLTLVNTSLERIYICMEKHVHAHEQLCRIKVDFSQEAFRKEVNRILLAHDDVICSYEIGFGSQAPRLINDEGELNLTNIFHQDMLRFVPENIITIHQTLTDIRNCMHAVNTEMDKIRSNLLMRTQIIQDVEDRAKQAKLRSRLRTNREASVESIYSTLNEIIDPISSLIELIRGNILPNLKFEHNRHLRNKSGVNTAQPSMRQQFKESLKKIRRK